MLTVFNKSFYFLKKHVFLALWISLISYFFYDTFIFYKNARQFYHLREILGLGLCISRGTATVLNLCCSLILLPMCKKLNQISYRVMSEIWPKLFFLWLEKSKSFHMTVATTTLLFSVMHSISHLFNLWNFSASYSDDTVEINFANYKNENPLLLLMSPAGLTGVTMLTIIVSMAATSTRMIRRTLYNAFWYTHQLYLPFMILLILHPLSGVLKQQVLENNDPSPDSSHYGSDNTNSTIVRPKFIAIKSTTWLWMVTPLACYLIDLIWRILSRNRARVEIVQVESMPGRTVSLMLSCPHDQFSCRMGQYILLQCLDVSLLEWHPFTVVQVPTSSQKEFVVWIRIKGDWTESLENLLLDYGNNKISVFVDGPFSSPMENVMRSDIAICVAAGVGITPFVSALHHMLRNPRSKFPGRVHLLWIVKYEEEITWLAELAEKTIRELRNANRPDRLHLEFYVTNNKNLDNFDLNSVTQVLVVDENGKITNKMHYYNTALKFDEKVALLTPKILNSTNNKAKTRTERNLNVDNNYTLAKKHPILACRLRRGRPHWDRVFGYWVHLYPGVTLDLYCCGPKDLVETLKHHCTRQTRKSKTTFTFVHEGF